MFMFITSQPLTVLQCTLENILENGYKRGAKMNNFWGLESLMSGYLNKPGHGY